MLLELQYALFGLSPRGYHATSIVLHSAVAVALYALTAMILYRVLRPSSWCAYRARRWLITGSHPLCGASSPGRGRCLGLVPAVLALHLLSLFSVLAYLRTFAGSGSPSPRWVFASWWLFLLALLSKAVAVALPAVLLILDIVLLQRIGPGKWTGAPAKHVWLEKVPFVALSLVFQLIAIWAKQSDDAVASIQNYGLPARIVQSCYGAAFYLSRTVWPFGLSAYYPLPRPIAGLWTTAYLWGIPLVGGTTLILILLGRRWAGLLACWVAFLVIVAPTSVWYELATRSRQIGTATWLR